MQENSKFLKGQIFCFVPSNKRVLRKALLKEGIMLGINIPDVRLHSAEELRKAIEIYDRNGYYKKG